MAERLHDLPRNSMDSVGVSGAAHDDTGSQRAGLFSSMFSSFCDKLFVLHELTESQKPQEKNPVSTLFTLKRSFINYNHVKELASKRAIFTWFRVLWCLALGATSGAKKESKSRQANEESENS